VGGLDGGRCSMTMDDGPTNSVDLPVGTRCLKLARPAPMCAPPQIQPRKAQPDISVTCTLFEIECKTYCLQRCTSMFLPHRPSPITAITLQSITPSFTTITPKPFAAPSDSDLQEVDITAMQSSMPTEPNRVHEPSAAHGLRFAGGCRQCVVIQGPVFQASRISR
jgi:hypothetical protein